MNCFDFTTNEEVIRPFQGRLWRGGFPPWFRFFRPWVNRIWPFQGYFNVQLTGYLKA